MPSSATCGPCWNWPASPISWAAPRTLCEAYGAGGWDLRFEDMKRIGDWIYVLGVNTLDEHLSYITIRGTRKARPSTVVFVSRALVGRLPCDGRLFHAALARPVLGPADQPHPGARADHDRPGCISPSRNSASWASSSKTWSQYWPSGRSSLISVARTSWAVTAPWPAANWSLASAGTTRSCFRHPSRI